MEENGGNESQNYLKYSAYCSDGPGVAGGMLQELRSFEGAEGVDVTNLHWYKRDSIGESLPKWTKLCRCTLKLISSAFGGVALSPQELRH